MPDDPKSFHRYLLADSKDRDWGIYATSAGYVNIEPGAPYPPAGHPKNYRFRWEDGRKLDELQIHFITRGGGIFESAPDGGHSQRITPGSAFILFPHVWHRYTPNVQTGWFEYWIGLKGDYVGRLLQKNFFTPAHPVFAPSDSSPLLRLFTEVVACLRHHSVGTSRVLGSLAGLIMAELQTGAVAVPPAENRTEHLVREAKLMLDQHLEQEVDLELMAKKLNVGYHWLRRAFRQETGQSLHQYRLQNRLSRAKLLLKSSDITIEQVAVQTGFTDPYYFSSIFKQKTGSTPSGWRRGDALPLT
ncbi:MAG: AraC family transcriptional regulator [Opitutaceae bacterium]|nr:AraC family transcriptional regulator [Opitutaceae bacterium]MBP9912114.1 AraC family transcriptional regulator [Opitutaceae bacterium]